MMAGDVPVSMSSLLTPEIDEIPARQRYNKDPHIAARKSQSSFQHQPKN